MRVTGAVLKHESVARQLLFICLKGKRAVLTGTVDNVNSTHNNFNFFVLIFPGNLMFPTVCMPFEIQVDRFLRFFCWRD